MANIIEVILKEIPESAKISNALYEGANIVLYTKNKDFFLDNSQIIKAIVNDIKKRIEVRADPSLCIEVEQAEASIRKIIQEEAKLGDITFDPQRSMVYIESEKPGLAIGKTGDLLKEIREQTLWVPVIKRIPAIRSKIIENIRQVLYENNDYRKKFLDKVGKRIYGNWIRGKKNSWVRVAFLGGAREVGRSCMLLETQESRVLLDCGVNIAATAPEDAYPILDIPEFNLQDIDAVIITHSHLDHSGFVPFLYKYGYKGPVYCTEPTRDVMSLLGLDYINVANKNAKKAIFSSTDIKEMVKHTICLEFEEVSDITPDIRLTFYNSGHVLGSAMAHLHIGNGLHNLLYTGDMKYGKTYLLEPAVTKFPRLETVIIESTYGGEQDVLPTRAEAEEQLLKVIKDTLDKKGKALIPVLGVGRSQEMMLIMHDYMQKGMLPKVPIYVQGMVWDITAIHTAYPNYLSNNVKKEIFHNDNNPFLSEIFKQVASQKEQQQVLEGGPCIILATSGMLTGGASLSYFKELADNPRNSIIFVNYQGGGSLGNRVQRGEKEIYMEGEKSPLKVNLNVVSIEGFSGHSGRNQLTSFVYNLDPKPKKIIIQHGESSKCLDLSSAIHKLNRIETQAPRDLDVIRIK